MHLKIIPIKKIKRTLSCKNISMNKEIKTKIKKLYMENQERLKQNYISIQIQKLIHHTEITLSSLVIIIILMMTWRPLIR